MARGGEDSGSLLGLVQRCLVAHDGAHLQAGQEAYDGHPAV